MRETAKLQDALLARKGAWRWGAEKLNVAELGQDSAPEVVMRLVFTWLVFDVKDPCWPTGRAESQPNIFAQSMLLSHPSKADGLARRLPVPAARAQFG